MLRMQQPTCTGIRIRSTVDAHKIFYAIQHGKLQMVTRRLDADERLALVSGCVYAWEERGPHTEITGLGIERFTEGKRWSPSRVRDEFLFYYEKYTPPESTQSSSEKPQPPRDWDPLVKQTYSVWVETEKGKRKWHLTAYFTQATVDSLGTIDDIQGVGELQVPDGMFKSTRLVKSRSSSKVDEPARSNETALRDAAAPARTYAPFPAPYSPSVPPQSAPQLIQMYEPYAATQYSHSRSPEQQYPVTPSSRHIPLPTRTPYQNGNRVVPQPEYNGQQDPNRYVSPSPRVIAQAPSFVVPSHSYAYTSATPDTNPAMYNSPISPSQPSPSWYDPSAREPYVQSSYSSHRPEYIEQSYHSPSPVRPLNSASAIYPSHYTIDGTMTYSSEPSMMSQEAVVYHSVYGSRGTYSDDGAASPTDSSTSSGRSGEIGPQRDLAPLHSLKRKHPYRRDPEDDKTLRLLDPRPIPSAP